MPEINHVRIESSGGKLERRKEFSVSAKAVCQAEAVIRNFPSHVCEGFHGWPHTGDNQAIVIVERHAITIRALQGGCQFPPRISVPSEEQFGAFAGGVLGEVVAYFLNRGC